MTLGQHTVFLKASCCLTAWAGFLRASREACIDADGAPAVTQRCAHVRKDRAQDHASLVCQEPADGSPPCTCRRRSERRPPLSSCLRTCFSALNQVEAVHQPIGTRTSQGRSEPRRRWVEDSRTTLRPSIGGCETSPATRSATSPRATGRDRGAPYELKRDGRSVGATDSCTRSIAPAARSSA